jgi:hypothetical protein
MRDKFSQKEGNGKDMSDAGMNYAAYERTTRQDQRGAGEQASVDICRR